MTVRSVCVCVLVEKSEADVEREQSLIDQWVCLTEERNAVLVPTAGSGIPGAPADWCVCVQCRRLCKNQFFSYWTTAVCEFC